MASVADVDAAIAHGPGLRWSLLGPFLNLHLSGGEGGIGALFEKPLWQATEDMWRDFGVSHVTEPLKQQVVSGTDKGDSRIQTSRSWCGKGTRILVQLLQLKAASRLLERRGAFASIRFYMEPAGVTHLFPNRPPVYPMRSANISDKARSTPSSNPRNPHM